jgi:NifU-like protein involved in Fe-S cluster formation
MNPSPYTEILLKHYKDPVNTGSVEGMEHVVEHRNRSCGDRVLLGVNVDAGVITQIRHESDGCMLCKASASIMCQILDGATVLRAKELRALVSRVCNLAVPEDELNFEGGFQGAATLDADDSDLPESRKGQTSAEKKTEYSASDIADGLTSGERKNLSNDLRALLEIRSFPTRKRCVTLPWEAFGELFKEASTTNQ